MARKPLLTPDQLEGVYEKLKRADEDIFNLNLEISPFLKADPDGGTAKAKRQTAQQWVNFHKERSIPPRFAVLAGEIVHHLRSCLEHIAWSLSSKTYRKTNETAIAFPIFTEPPNKKTQPRYDGNIGGITSPAARKLIEELQPYKGAHPVDDPLAIVHELDRIDKHHEVVLVIATFEAHVETFAEFSARRARSGLEADQDTFARESTQKESMQISRQVAFAEFGKRKDQSVIPSLTELANAIRDVIRMFAELRI